MRSTITLDEKFLRPLLTATEAHTKTEAVVVAIQDYLKRKKILKIKNLKGKIHFDKTADEIRHYER